MHIFSLSVFSFSIFILYCSHFQENNSDPFSFILSIKEPLLIFYVWGCFKKNPQTESSNVITFLLILSVIVTFIPNFYCTLNNHQWLSINKKSTFLVNDLKGKKNEKKVIGAKVGDVIELETKKLFEDENKLQHEENMIE